MTDVGVAGRDRTWTVLCHLSSLAGIVLPAAGNWLGPLVVWLVKRDEDPEVDRHGKEALNFNLSILIWTFVSALLCFVFVGFILLPLVFILHIVCTIMAGIRASEGGFDHYPMTIRFIG